MTMTHRAMLVEAAYVDLARALTAAFEPVSGAGMFVTPVYATDGTIPYYCSNGHIQDVYAEMLDDATGDKLWAAIQAAGVQVPEVAVRAMMQTAIVRADCNVLDIVAEMGLAGHSDPTAEDAL